MERYALLGWPVGHSLSPGMQHAGFEACGIRASYECIAVPPEEFASKIRQLVAEGYRGWNVTIPHKGQMAMVCDCIAGEEARAAGSVNTVLVRDGRIYGYSTDGIGVARALRHSFGMKSQPLRQLYLGAGGAAQAAAVYAARHGAEKIYLANRTLAKAEALARRLRELAPHCRIAVLPLADAADVVRDCDLVLQCTSLGLHPGDSMPLSPGVIPRSIPVLDFVYTPSAFREALCAQGNPVADGREMLLQQGMESFRLWTGLVPPEDAMRGALFP